MMRNTSTKTRGTLIVLRIFVVDAVVVLVGSAAVTTTRSTFKIEDSSLGPGKVDFTAPDEGFGLEGTSKP